MLVIFHGFVTRKSALALSNLQPNLGYCYVMIIRESCGLVVMRRRKYHMNKEHCNWWGQPKNYQYKYFSIILLLPLLSIFFLFLLLLLDPFLLCSFLFFPLLFSPFFYNIWCIESLLGKCTRACLCVGSLQLQSVIRFVVLISIFPLLLPLISLVLPISLLHSCSWFVRVSSDKIENP